MGVGRVEADDAARARHHQHVIVVRLGTHRRLVILRLGLGFGSCLCLVGKVDATSVAAAVTANRLGGGECGC